MRALGVKAAQRLWTALALLAATVAALAGFVTVLYWNDLWFDRDFFSSDSYRRSTQTYVDAVWNVAELTCARARGEEPDYLDKERLSVLEKALDPDVTNFRCQLHTRQGVLLWDNLEGQVLDQVVGGMTTVVSGVGYYAIPGQANSYVAVEVVAEYGALRGMDHYDGIRAAWDNFNLLHQAWLPTIAWVAAIFIVITFVLLPLMCRAARQRARETGPRLLDRIPLDLTLLLLFACGLVVLFPGMDIMNSFIGEPFRPLTLVGSALFFAVMALLVLELLSTLSVRWGRGMLKNTLVYKLFAAIGRGFRNLLRVWPMSRRPAALFVGFLGVNAALSALFFRALFTNSHSWLFFLLLLVGCNGFVLVQLCRWARQWRELRQATDQIVAGEGVTVDADGFFRDLSSHAQALNSLGRTVEEAVERETRSQRFQAELITNVSHDLKTPLTSVINYVDLLKKTDQHDPKAVEYLAVLDRQSRRLKKLTEDLVEASKASTGALPVNLEPLDLGELVGQAAAEYRDRLQERDLEVVVTAPAEQVAVLADGRHLWRVLDNLLGNCVKYALPGTRVYLEVNALENGGQVTVKNVSAQALNCPPEELLARFVRGDGSRSTEGSGLGLSIAQNLTQLQGGNFSLQIDGDLFKAEVTLPGTAGTAGGTRSDSSATPERPLDHPKEDAL